jgi:uncharacterized protein (PEP-CTERM system associated)
VFFLTSVPVASQTSTRPGTLDSRFSDTYLDDPRFAGRSARDARRGPESLTGWVISPDIRLKETYDDNPTLAPRDAKHGDFITEVTAGLHIEGNAPRLRANVDYRPSLFLYARDSEEDRLVNRLRAFGSLEAVENFFFIDVHGIITQDFISPFGARPADLGTSTSNRTETRTFGISPHIRGELEHGYVYELRNRNLWTSSDTEALGNVHSTHWNGRFASPVRLFGWALEYEESKIRQEEFTQQPDREMKLVRGRLFFQPDYALRFSVSAGWEENNYEVLRETTSNSIYGAGVAWNPGVRTTVEAQYEERFFGPSRLARLRHRTRLTAWSLNYSRGVSDRQEELLRLPPGNTAALVDAIFAPRIPDPTERRAAVDQFLFASGTPSFLSSSLSFYTTQIFLQERLDASVGIIGVRNSLTFLVFASDSERISEGLTGVVPDAFLLGDRIKMRGFGLRADHKLTPFTWIGASAIRTHSRQEEPTVSSIETRNDNLTLTLNHRLSPRTITFAGLGYYGLDNEIENRDATSTWSYSLFVGLDHRF